MRIRIPRLIEDFLMNMDCQTATEEGEEIIDSGVSIIETFRDRHPLFAMVLGRGVITVVTLEVHSFTRFIRHLLRS